MKLPSVTVTTQPHPHHIILTLELAPTHEAFNGHFPHNPILPGVVQIDWAVRLAALHLGLQNIHTQNFQVKFKNIIRPALPLALTLQFDANKNQLSFAYHSGDDLMSSGHFKAGRAS